MQNNNLVTRQGKICLCLSWERASNYYKYFYQARSRAEKRSPVPVKYLSNDLTLILNLLLRPPVTDQEQKKKVYMVSGSSSSIFFNTHNVNVWTEYNMYMFFVFCYSY